MHPFWIRGCACAAQCARECGLRPSQRARLPTVARLLDSSPTTCNAQALGGQARYLLHACLKRRKLARTMCSNLLFIFLAEKWLRIRNQKWQVFSSLRPRARCSAQRATRARAQSTQLARSTKRVRTHANNRTRSAPHSAAQRSQTQDVKPQRRAPYHGAAHRIITSHATSQRRTTHDNTSPPTTLHHNTTQHNATHEAQRQADVKLGWTGCCTKVMSNSATDSTQQRRVVAAWQRRKCPQMCGRSAVSSWIAGPQPCSADGAKSVGYRARR